MTAQLTYHTSFELKHGGDCHLLGVNAQLQIYVEEIYGTHDLWIAQHQINMQHEYIESIDESFGQNADVAPLTMPDDIVKSQPGWHSMRLNFVGPRHRGLRSPERVDDMVRSLTMQEKMQLVKRLGLDLPPPMLLGLAESYVVAEAQLDRPHRFVICRRLRIAYALMEQHHDDAGQPYDYDTAVLYIAQIYDRSVDDDPPLDAALSAALPGVEMHRPMGCVLVNDHLFVADGGGEERKNRVHVWRVERTEDTDDT